MEPRSPALAGRFFTVEPPGKSLIPIFFFFPPLWHLSGSFLFSLCFKQFNVFQTFNVKIFSYIISLIISLLCTLSQFLQNSLVDVEYSGFILFVFYSIFSVSLSYCSMSWDIYLVLSSNTSLELHYSSKALSCLLKKNDIVFLSIFSRISENNILRF